MARNSRGNSVRVLKCVQNVQYCAVVCNQYVSLSIRVRSVTMLYSNAVENSQSYNTGCSIVSSGFISWHHYAAVWNSAQHSTTVCDTAQSRAMVCKGLKSAIVCNSMQECPGLRKMSNGGQWLVITSEGVSEC